MMSVNDLLNVLVCQMDDSGNGRTASAYKSAVQSILSELGGDISFERIFTHEAITLYEKRLIAKGLCNNTISFYMRMLRAIYNKGVLLGVFPAIPDLFMHVYTGIDSTPKRAVSAEIFGLLQNLDLSGKQNLAFCRDLFLLSFSLQGISFVDLAYLRKSDLRGSILTYHRAKTGSVIHVAISGVALEIINKYSEQTKDSLYLLPIIRNPRGDIKLQYQSALRTHNRRLKKLAEMAGITDNLTSYVARHSWATTARRVEVPVGVISQAMGHKTEEVTQIYLADFDHSMLFMANERVLIAARLISCSETEKTENPDKQNNVRHLRSDGHFRMQI